MANKKIQLTLLSIALIFVIFSVPFNNHWLHDKILNDNVSIFDQAQNTDVQFRLEYRFGSAFNAYNAITKTLESSPGFKNVLLLIPPQQYLRETKIEGGFDGCEPVVFYYFTGIKSVIAKSPNVSQANWAFVAEGHSMWLKKLDDKRYFDNLIEKYKKYEY